MSAPVALPIIDEPEPIIPEPEPAMPPPAASSGPAGAASGVGDSNRARRAYPAPRTPPAPSATRAARRVTLATARTPPPPQRWIVMSAGGRQAGQRSSRPLPILRKAPPGAPRGGGPGLPSVGAQPRGVARDEVTADL